MKQSATKNELRMPEQIRAHYEIEKELANKLRYATKQERLSLYSSLYDELYRRVPLHPQLTRKLSPIERLKPVLLQLRFLRKFLNDTITFLEIGPGDCALSFEVAKYVKHVLAIDVSGEISKSSALPNNFTLILSDGINIPVQPNSVELAYSYNVMEHLHPDDALDQLKGIFTALIPGGTYICITPNRLTGPHDVSKYFDLIATGFHLKEYTTLELSRLFKKVGFSRVKVFFGAKGIYLALPPLLIGFFEIILDKLQMTSRKVLHRNLPLLMPGIRIFGIK
jgi:SAM-dependent methyltransferase